MLNSSFKNNVTIIFLVFVIAIFIVMGSIIIQYSNDFLYVFSQSKMKNWQQEYKDRGIKEISIIIDTNSFKNTNDKNRFQWFFVKKIYSNMELKNLNQYKTNNDIIYNKCNKNYILLPKKSIDSVVYKFSPIYIYEEFNSKKEKIFSTIEFSSKRKLNKKYSDLLPSCH